MISPHDPNRCLHHVLKGMCQNGVYTGLLKHVQCGAIVVVIIIVIMTKKSVSFVGRKTFRWGGPRKALDSS